MPPRLADRYPIGTRVEITFGGGRWFAGIVVAHEHPGVWVEMEDRRRWFVTNGRRIRRAAQEPQNN